MRPADSRWQDLASPHWSAWSSGARCSCHQMWRGNFVFRSRALHLQVRLLGAIARRPTSRSRQTTSPPLNSSDSSNKRNRHWIPACAGMTAVAERLHQTPHWPLCPPPTDRFALPRGVALGDSSAIRTAVRMGSSTIMRKTLIAVAFATALAGCSGQQAPAPQNQTDASFEAKLQEQLLDAKPGSVIEIPAGHYHLKRGLSLRTDGVTIRGAGKDQTVLSFKGQVVGPEGLLVNANDFTNENLTIEDTKGDALKINHGRNITIHGVRTQWTDGSKTSNGPYGIYPVKTQNTLIED